MILFCLFSLVRILLMAFMTRRWSRIRVSGSEPGQVPAFSVIIPVRNEACNIGNLLEDIDRQHYPKEKFEVIVVDDDSEDGTGDIVRAFQRTTDISLRCLSLKAAAKTGKKAALTWGIRHAVNDYIITTDGDCRLGNEWMAAYAGGYNAPDRPVMLTGPVRMSDDGFFAGVQAVEFSALIGFGAVSLQSGKPGPCNGANLSYKKEVFSAVEGYTGNEHVPSGDDEFLLAKVHGKFPGRVRFLKDPNAVVSTPAKPSFLELINQRMRWSSKWKYHKRSYLTFSALGFFLDYALMIAAIFLAITGYWPLFWVIFIMFSRWLSELIYLRSVSRFLGVRVDLFRYIPIQIIYPLFVIFLGLASIFGTYSWKGRRYV